MSFTAVGVGLVLISALHSVVAITPPVSAPGKIRALIMLRVLLHTIVELFSNCTEARRQKKKNKIRECAKVTTLQRK